jgi:single-strand DNA-binding protein
MGTLRNSVHLIGRPGMDPEVKTYGEGKKVVRFTFATNEKHYNDKMELVAETEWHNIVSFGRTAEQAERLIRKGRLTALEGKIQTRQYEDANKNKRYFTEILMDEFMLIDRMSAGEDAKEETVEKE